jgi:hypothetical protein
LKSDLHLTVHRMTLHIQTASLAYSRAENSYAGISEMTE